MLNVNLKKRQQYNILAEMISSQETMAKCLTHRRTRGIPGGAETEAMGQVANPAAAVDQKSEPQQTGTCLAVEGLPRPRNPEKRDFSWDKE